MACVALATKLTNACTSGIAKLRDPIKLKQAIAQNLCQGSIGVGFSGLALSATNPAGTSVTTSSYQPSSNALLIAAIVTNTGINTQITSVTGNGLTWVRVAQVQEANLATGVAEIWRAMGAAPALGGLTVNSSGATMVSGIIIRVVQFSSVNTSGTNGSGAIVQSVTNRNLSSTNPNVTLAAFNTNGLNTGFFICGKTSGNPFSGTAETGWTADVNSGVGTTGAFVGYQIKNTDNTMVITSALSDWYMAGIEIKSAFS